MFWTLIEVLQWLTKPSIVPWLGMLAAVGASIAARDRSDWRHPSRWVFAAIRGVVVWTVLVFLLASLWQWGSGNAEDGIGKGTRPTEDLQSDQTGDAAATMATAIAGRNTVKSMQDTFNVETDVTIQFVPSPANQTITQPFACDILVRESIADLADDDAERDANGQRDSIDSQTAAGLAEITELAEITGLAAGRNRVERTSGRRVQIRAVDMQKFESSLTSQLRQIAAAVRPDRNDPVTVSIRKDPFPGVPALQMAADKIRSVGWPLEMAREE